MLLVIALTWLLLKGVGIWGINIPVGWGFAIINFVWWIGIGHAGTLISAILLLLQQKWRTSINRFAEAMTLFAVACAGHVPAAPHSAARGSSTGCSRTRTRWALWPQFRSPLVWDVFAVSTYATVSLLFWYVGLIPDLATLRDRAADAVGAASSTACSRWAGAARRGTGTRYETAYLLLAGLATPLVVSVHTVVSFDFAVGDRPRLAHDDLPALLRRRRDLLRLRDGADAGDPAARGLRPARTSSPCATSRTWRKVMLATGLIVAYGYVIEAFIAWYSGNQYERFMICEPHDRPVRAGLLGADLLQRHRAAAALVQAACAPTPLLLFVISLVVNVGMWLERFVIVVTSLHRDFLPSSWGMY